MELHISDAESPTIRLEQDGPGGWAVQIRDVGGNETSFFVRDLTNSYKLPFRIQSNTHSSALSLESTGFVGIGAWEPDARLHVYAGESFGAASDYADVIIEDDDNAELQFLCPSGHSGSIQFGDDSDQNAGGITYLHDSESTSSTIDWERRTTTSTGSTTKTSALKRGWPGWRPCSSKIDNPGTPAPWIRTGAANLIRRGFPRGTENTGA